MSLARALVVTFTVGIAACDAPHIVERSASACRNRIDDDGDGMADCDDVDCALTAVCETTVAACRNGIDDDGNGLADCEQRSCLDHADHPCAAYVPETPCDLVTSAGCVEGLSCQAVVDGGVSMRVCTPHGTRDENTSCTPDDGLSTPCAVGTCLFGFCSRYCSTDADCTADAHCLPIGEFSICSVPCTPFDAAETCGADAFCASLHSLGFAYFEGGGSYACFENSLAAAFAGTATEGDVCDADPVASTPASTVCRRDLVCMPDVDDPAFTHHCRRGCLADVDHREFGRGCDSGACERCVPSYPLDDRLPAGSARRAAGVCLCQVTPAAGGACECAP